MEKQRQGIAHHLLDIAFDKADPIPSNFSADTGPSQWFNENLDQSQREAVAFALASRDISIIHGPPGTGKHSLDFNFNMKLIFIGKTTTIVEYILQEAMKRDAKILCCAPSNIAVDNLVERLGRKRQLKLIRLGHPARLLESIQRFSLESIVMENYQDVKNAIREDLNQCFVRLNLILISLI
jgi:ATP-dependent RNA/DNA helicase IGHMBP2